MIAHILTQLREKIPSKIEYLITNNTREQVPFAELELAKKYYIEGDVAVWVAEETNGTKRLDFKFGEASWSAHYTRKGILHGEIYASSSPSSGAEIRCMALNGALCGRIIIETGSCDYHIVLHEPTNTYILTLLNQSGMAHQLQTRERVYMNHPSGFYETYNTETSNLVKVVSYMDGLRHGIQGSWFKNGSPRKMISLYQDQGHGDYVVFHPDGATAQSGSVFMGEKFGEWKIWATGVAPGPKDNHSVFYKPALPLDWLSVVLDEDGSMQTTDPNKPDTQVIKLQKTKGKTSYSKACVSGITPVAF